MTKIPRNVDPKAKLIDDQWHKGELNNAGKPVGHYTIWNKKGILLCDGEFTKHSQILWFKVFHPNGELGCTSSKDLEPVTYKLNRDYPIISFDVLHGARCQQCYWVVDMASEGKIIT